MNEKLIQLFKDYSKVYTKFEEFQKENILPNGDQKTGVIAEYYAKIYIEKIILKGNKKIRYSNPGSCFDLSYFDNNGQEIKVQVKAVSAYSKTRIIAPLNLSENAFDILYLFDLDKYFMPINFYINTFKDIIQIVNSENKKDKTRIIGSTLRGINYENKKINGSKYYNIDINYIKDLKLALNL